MSRPFGSVRQLTSGRWQARYTGPNGRSYTARTTFGTKRRARDELARIQVDIERDKWAAPGSVSEPTMFGAFAETWFATRDLSPSTRLLYRQSLDHWILPTFGHMPVPAITPPQVRKWNAHLATGPSAKARAYSLLRTILNTAVDDDLITVNPCRIRGAGQANSEREIQPASLAELEVLVENMPDRWQALVLLAAWCALRWGELTELRRNDIDLVRGIVRVRRSVVRTGSGKIVKTPKTAAGKRDVSIPPPLIPVLREHLREHAQFGAQGLLFPAADGGHLANVTFGRAYYRARDAAGRPDLRLHDLRHTGATLAAATGATLKELMDRLGHSTPSMALRYQHTMSDRPQAIAAILGDMMTGGTVTDIDSKRA
jgi:integrase